MQVLVVKTCQTIYGVIFFKGGQVQVHTDLQVHRKKGLYFFNYSLGPRVVFVPHLYTSLEN